MELIKRRMRTLFGPGQAGGHAGAHGASDRAVMEQVEPRQLLSGSVTPKLVAVPIGTAAVSADASLSSFKSYDLQVTVTGTNHWTAGQLLIKLKTGSFYLPSGATQTPDSGL